MYKLSEYSLHETNKNKIRIKRIILKKLETYGRIQKKHRKPIPETGFQCFIFKWWAVQGLNLRPPACKAGALPAELTARLKEAKNMEIFFYCQSFFRQKF